MFFCKKGEETIKTLKDELKKRPKVLDIPPLGTVVDQESRLWMKSIRNTT